MLAQTALKRLEVKLRAAHRHDIAAKDAASVNKPFHFARPRAVDAFIPVKSLFSMVPCHCAILYAIPEPGLLPRRHSGAT